MMLTGQGGGGYDDDGDEDASDYEEEGEALDEDAELGDGAAVDLDPARFMALAGFGDFKTLFCRLWVSFPLYMGITFAYLPTTAAALFTRANNGAG
jgi:hypothetical protein